MQTSPLYPSSTKEGKCVFCEIVKGTLQTPGVFREDGDYMAFLSKRPNTKGFSVVIPKHHFGSDVLDMPDEVLQQFIVAAKKVSQILLTHFNDVGRVWLMMEWTWVDHAHIKLFPMHGTGHMKHGIWKQYHGWKQEYFEHYEGYIISTEGPQESEENLKALAEELKKTKSNM